MSSLIYFSCTANSDCTAFLCHSDMELYGRMQCEYLSQYYNIRDSVGKYLFLVESAETKFGIVASPDNSDIATTVNLIETTAVVRSESMETTDQPIGEDITTTAMSDIATSLPIEEVITTNNVISTEAILTTTSTITTVGVKQPSSESLADTTQSATTTDTMTVSDSKIFQPALITSMHFQKQFDRYTFDIYLTATSSRSQIECVSECASTTGCEYANYMKV